MSKAVNDPNKERVKLYKKVRNISSWGSIFLYLLLSCIFILTIILASGFILEYIAETKFDLYYKETEQIALLYETEGRSEAFLQEYGEDSYSYIVKDSSGEIIDQQGRITCSPNGAQIIMENGLSFRTVYEDTEENYLFPRESGTLGFNVKKFFASLDFPPQNFKFPLWISVSINDGKAEFIGKAYVNFNSRDSILILELITVLMLVTVVIGAIMLIYVIKSVVNYRRVVKLFYSDPITSGHNWIWYVRYGDDAIHRFFSRKNNYGVVNLSFTNYRNYCLCHSITEGEQILSKIDKILSKEVKRGELSSYAGMSDFALLLKYENDSVLKMRLQNLIKTLQTIDTDHTLDFQVGVDLIASEKDEDGKLLKRSEITIENAYNNACSARSAIGESEDSGIRFFDKKLLDEQRWRDTVIDNQWNALNNEEFLVYYQPKYDPKTEVLRGAEALIRWQSPEYGFVTPGRFIPIFEKSGFITEIDHYMIRHAAEDQKAWLDAGYKCVPISVNVSRAHFAENDLAEQIRDIVDKTGCPHELIEIELTESAFFDDKKAMINTINRLKEYGFAVSMDDFGAGYSSLNSLKDMPLDVLKLDAEFFRGENTGKRGEIVVSEAIKLAKNLEMRTVAEGVEVKDQVDFLADQGCDMIQGYYFSKPLPKEEYTERMSRA